ncbi:DUF373 family protein [Natronosalvus vescus]|uniref:DUF373 family protein n=1 Tax=Natronosalvus vescus TaxID=2953881 RepID=UPI0020914A4A|nr:DUF373 family protein [Natronosalvus vescus]
MTTLVVCLDRTDDVGRRTGLRTPIVGWEAVRALVTDVGLADPEDSGVNTLLESLRVAQSLRDDDEETVVAVVSGDRDSMVSADRAVAHQLDELMAEYQPDSAIVVIDSAEDERLVPIVESRVQVDAVDRVVVRQARDIESTYYLLKQFLADEELRQTILVPLGLTLLVFPVLATFVGPAEGAATITAVIGLFLLYKGFSIDELLAGLGRQLKDSLYSGQVSIVTYVVAIGLSLVGLFIGALGVSNLGETQGAVVPTMQFVFDSVPWLAAAALTASAGRLFDELIREEPLRSSYLHLPFLVVAVGLVIRGFSGFFLEQQGQIDPFVIPQVMVDEQWGIQSFPLTSGQRLAMFVSFGFALSLIGVRIAARYAETPMERQDDLSGASSGKKTQTVRNEAELTDGGSKAAEGEADEDNRAESDDGEKAEAEDDVMDHDELDELDELDEE